MSIHFFCSTFPATFGQFPTETSSGACVSITRQGVTASVAAVELGVVTTDIHVNGTFNVVIGPVAPGTYTLEFIGRNGAGCGLAGGGACDVAHAEADFQSPGPIFGDATTIVIPWSCPVLLLRDDFPLVAFRWSNTRAIAFQC